MEENITLLDREEIKNYEIEDVPDNQLEGPHLAVVNLVLERLDKPITIICSENMKNSKISECQQLLTKIYQFQLMITWWTLRSDDDNQT